MSDHDGDVPEDDVIEDESVGDDYDKRFNLIEVRLQGLQRVFEREIAALGQEYPEETFVSAAEAYIGAVQEWADAEILTFQAQIETREAMGEGALTQTLDRAFALAVRDAVEICAMRAAKACLKSQDAFDVMQRAAKVLGHADKSWRRWYTAGGGSWAPKGGEGA